MKKYTKEYEELRNELNDLERDWYGLQSWCIDQCRNLNIDNNKEYTDTLEEKNIISRKKGEIGKKLRQLESEGKKYENNQN